MELIKYDDKETIKVLKQTVAAGLSDSEFALFAQYCQSTGLNPFKKEIWAIKAGGRLQLLCGINGYLAVANAHPQFDGMECSVDNDENPTRAVCKVYRKDRKYPSEGVALLKEYRKNSPIWKEMPRVMLTKVAKSIAIREAFPQELNGIYTQEEMPPEYSKDTKADIVRQSVVVEEAVTAPSGEPTDHIIETPCRFGGATVGDAYASDPDWLIAVHNNPKKWEKMTAADQSAISKFCKQIITKATTPLPKEAPVAVDADTELFEKGKK